MTQAIQNIFTLCTTLRHVLPKIDMPRNITRKASNLINKKYRFLPSIQKRKIVWFSAR